MSNRISPAFTTPGEHRNVVWVSDRLRHEQDPGCIPKVIQWCADHGLDAPRIPHPHGMVICLDGPDGGLTAYVTEVEVTDPAEPLKSTVRRPDGSPVLLPVRAVPVSSVPPSGGIVPEWAAYLLREAAV